MKSDLKASAADIERQIKAAEAGLRQVLLSGGDTAAARTYIADLKRERDGIQAEIGAANAAQAAAEQQQWHQRASSLAAASAQRLAERLAALTIPAHPFEKA
jgi:hypothetical protein